MREIKFRAWDESRREMVEDRQLVFWAGNVYRNESGTLNDPEKPHKGARLNGYSVMRDKIMQCTGIRDAYGKEVYDGDLLKSAGGICQIVWHYNRWAIRNENRRIEEIGRDFHHFFSVIGNIYENPELLQPTSGHYSIANK